MKQCNTRIYSEYYISFNRLQVIPLSDYILDNRTPTKTHHEPIGLGSPLIRVLYTFPKGSSSPRRFHHDAFAHNLVINVIGTFFSMFK